MLRRIFFFLSVFHASIAWPTLLATRQNKKFEWTALGDSYAAGVGTTNYVDGRRCLRYDQAYPVLLNGDSNFVGKDYVFNNVVCSGSHCGDVEKYQFYEKDTYNQPNWEYCMKSQSPNSKGQNTHIVLAPRPKFGNPQMATLSVGGDDIDFPGILFNCILEYHVYGGPAYRTCDEQRKYTWGLIKSPDLVKNLDHLIKKTIARGRSGTIGDKFKLYVTGYAEFFNEVDKGCNTVTFARAANPNPDGKEHTKLTTELRKDFNQMSIKLNAAIQDAVARNKDKGVKFIDIQGNGVLNGHRFCEPGVKEPDPHNDKLWFWHYPYHEPSSANSKLLQQAADKVSKGLSTADLSAKYPITADYTNAIFGALDFTKAQLVNGGDPEAKGLWDFLGFRAKVFHPQFPLHNHIKDLIFKQYRKDAFDQAIAQLSGSKPPKALLPRFSEKPDPLWLGLSRREEGSSSAPDKNECHGVSGDTWVMHRDIAVDNVKEFCAQSSKSKE